MAVESKQILFIYDPFCCFSVNCSWYVNNCVL